MVTIAPKEKGWSDVGEAFGTGFVSGHQNRHDEMALQNAIGGLGENASMKDVLKAITGTRTYSPEAKQNLLKNYLGTEEFEETRRHHKATEETALATAKANEAKANAKAAQGPKLLISEKPMEPEQVKGIESVTSNPDYEKWDDPTKLLAFNKAGVSGVNSERILKAEGTELNKALTFHNQTEKYNEDIDKNATAAKKQVQYIKGVREAIKNVSPLSASNVLSKFGPYGKALSEAFLTKDAATINNAIPAFLEGSKEIFGVRLSDADLKILEDKLPSMAKSKEANDQILNIMEKYANQSILKGKITDEIKSKAKNKMRPVDFREQVNKKFDYEIEPVKLKDPDTGIEFEAERYRVEDWIRAGAELADEQ